MASNKKQNTDQKTKKSIDDNFSIVDLLKLCVQKWYWFLISLAFFGALAAIYLYVKTPAYNRSAQIMIKQESSGLGMMGGLDAFGILSQSSDVYNEVAAFSSPDLLEEVIKRLNLETSYVKRDFLKKYPLYGKTLPIQVRIYGQPIEVNVRLRVKLHADGTYEVDKFKLGKYKVKGRATGKLGTITNTPIGKIEIIAGPAYKPGEKMTIDVARIYPRDLAYEYKRLVKIGQHDDKSSIINIELNDPSPKRAEDILNMIITVYNERWIQDKNSIADGTSNFIKQRLQVIQNELGIVDETISDYRSNNLVPDLKTASAMYLQNAENTNAAIISLRTSIEMAKYIRNYISDPLKRYETMPVNLGFENSNLSGLISKYNEEVIARNNVLKNSSESNPVVKDMDNSLDGLRASIKTSIDNQIINLESQIRAKEGYENEKVSQLAATPRQAKDLLANERTQKVKESLYLYLLQKLEETELSKSDSDVNTRMIMAPGGERIPSKPKKRNIIILAIFFGFAIPIGLIYLKESLNTKVRGIKDIKDIALQTIGLIPAEGAMPGTGKWKSSLGIKRKSDANTDRGIVVERGNRSAINEAFRVMRTNLDFVMKGATDQNVIAITSTETGSGKTFVSINIATSYAIAGKRVLIIDGDLRHASLSRYVGSHTPGMADYLEGKASASSIIYTSTQEPNLSYIPVGITPPNPTELLESQRFDDLIAELRSMYDIVFIDCPPAGIVADAQIIDRLADRTIFVVRVATTESASIELIEHFNEEDRFKNVLIALNGVSGIDNKKGIGYYNS